MSKLECATDSHLRHGSPMNRRSDIGPIPSAMLDDIRRLLWSMEKAPMYWGVGMALIIGAVWIGGVVVFATAEPRPGVDRTSIGIGAGALTVLAALLYSPFLNRWFDSNFEAKVLREALYTQRLEDLSSYISSCRMGGRDKVADQLVAIWIKHGLEPSSSARPVQPKPQFK